MPDYWQVASGSRGRDFAEDFLEHGMAFVGGDDNIGAMKQVKLSDVMILKRGNSRIAAVGRVVERGGKHVGVDDKEWLEVDGWYLPAYCYVRWHRPSQDVEVGGLTRKTMERAHQHELQEIARQILTECPSYASRITDPPPTREVSDEEILEFLIQEGLSPTVAEDLTSALRRVRLLARYYRDRSRWEDVREHETRTFLILPVLLALGWSEQQMKIELGTRGGKRIDIACFSRAYYRKENGEANNEDCALIIESKGFDSGLHYANDQAVAYAENFPSCRAVLVSNGYSYKAFERDATGAFSQKPSAYLNLLNPRDRYPLDPEQVDGALGVLRLLLPLSWR